MCLVSERGNSDRREEGEMVDRRKVRRWRSQPARHQNNKERLLRRKIHRERSPSRGSLNCRGRSFDRAIVRGIICSCRRNSLTDNLVRVVPFSSVVQLWLAFTTNSFHIKLTTATISTVARYEIISRYSDTFPSERLFSKRDLILTPFRSYPLSDVTAATTKNSRNRNPRRSWSIPNILVVAFNQKLLYFETFWE